MTLRITTRRLLLLLTALTVAVLILRWEARPIRKRRAVLDFPTTTTSTQPPPLLTTRSFNATVARKEAATTLPIDDLIHFHLSEKWFRSPKGRFVDYIAALFSPLRQHLRRGSRFVNVTVLDFSSDVAQFVLQSRLGACPNIFLILTPPGLHYANISQTERSIDDIGRRDALVLWHIPVQDGRSDSPGDPPFDVDGKELNESVAEIATAAASLNGFSRASPRNFEAPLHVFRRRTAFDPDFFQLKAPGRVELALREGEVRLPEEFGVLFAAAGNHTPQFGYPTEGSSRHNVWNVSTTEVSQCGERIIVDSHHSLFMHYPWVLDNVYHTHNDNLMPLVLASELSGNRNPKHRRLVLLPTRRRNVALPVFSTLAPLLFSGGPVTSLPVRSAKQRSDTGNTTWDVCVTLMPNATLVFGRPPRFFAKEPETPVSYIESGVLATIRGAAARVAEVGTSAVCARSRRADLHSVRVVWLDRRGRRRLLNADDLLQGIMDASSTLSRNATVEIVRCCDGLSYSEQVTTMATADILVGVHGAGLLHTLHLSLGENACRASGKPAPVVFHIGSRRMNYHEQTVIERLALALAPVVRYRVTRSYTSSADATAAWQNDFELPAVEARLMGVDAIRTYLSA